ncbi:primosomal protein N' [bacterium]|nr:primosomal protein N' [bacterium]
MPVKTEKQLYAQVVFELAIDKSFDYIIPESLRDNLQPGSLVYAPFGTKKLLGFVSSISDKSNIKQLKEIYEIYPENLFAQTHLFALVKWISDYYFCPLGLVFKAVYPPYLRKKRRDRETLLVSVMKNKEDIIRFIDRLPEKFKKQKSVLEYLLKKRYSFIPLDEIKKAVQTDKKVIEALSKKNFLELLTESEVIRRGGRIKKYNYVDSIQNINLSADQSNTLNTIYSFMAEGGFKPILLHGVTGSGKTEIYLRAIKRVIDTGKQAIVLIPEISLTPQTEERFRKRFGDIVAVFHSRLSDAERAYEWRKMKDGRASLVVGARSAVFAPFENLGIIVVDEEHERTYKQEDAPRYNARDVAVVRANIAGIPVVLGSATPSLESIMNVQRKKYSLIELPKRIDNRPLPEIHIVDLEKEIREEKRWVVLSYLLREKIKDRMEKGEQCILFLNRRGFSSMLLCEKCGFVFECGDCSVSLKYHKSIEKMVCHFCGKMFSVPKFCPSCGSKEIKFTGMGTQKVERALRASFPDARILRMDSDTTTHKNSHEEYLSQFRRGKADILLGTQMIAKGLDFPRVTLVGIILAESTLLLPDFRASESTFQLLTQVAGRSGRGEINGEVVIQTFMSEHPAVQCAVKQDYNMFAEYEMKSRQELAYPPFKRFINILALSKNNKKAHWSAQQLVSLIERNKPAGTEIKGPSPSVIEKKRGYFHWNILIKTNNIFKVNEAIRKALIKRNRFSGVTINVDVDPYFMW